MDGRYTKCKAADVLHALLKYVTNAIKDDNNVIIAHSFPTEYETNVVLSVQSEGYSTAECSRK
jgi:hypothetical protein